MSDRELLQQALNALETLEGADYTTSYAVYPSFNEKLCTAAEEAIRARLAQPEVNYQDLYEKEKRRSEMWASKYVAACGETRVIELAQPEQEPVARVVETTKTPIIHAIAGREHQLRVGDFLYTTPQQAAQPVPLSDEQITSAFAKHDEKYSLVASFWSFEAGVRFAEAAHGIGSKP